MPRSRLSSLIRELGKASFFQEGLTECLTDGQLLENFVVRRDEAAFAALVRRHGPMVLAVCRRVLRHAQDAEDAFQATFLVLARKARSIRQRELVGNWLYGTAYRAALEARAARRRLRERSLNWLPEPVAVQEHDSWRELWPILDQELRHLPDKYRVAVVLCDLEGRTRREVARQLGLPLGTLSGRLTTARRRLARRLARHGLGLSAGMVAAALAPRRVLARVPAALAKSTAHASFQTISRAALIEGVSAPVLSLEKKVLRTMFLKKCKVVAILLMVSAVTGLALHRLSGPTTSRAQAEPRKQPPAVAAQPLKDKVALLERLFRLPDDLVKAKKTDGEIVDSLFCAALARLPGETERGFVVKHLRGARDRQEAARDLLWALVNGKEFARLHHLNGDPRQVLMLLNKYATSWEKKAPPPPADPRKDPGNLEMGLQLWDNRSDPEIQLNLGPLGKYDREVDIVEAPAAGAKVRQRLKKKVNDVYEAFLKGDVAKLVDNAHPVWVSREGGREKMIATLSKVSRHLKERGFVFESLSVKEPTDIIVDGTRRTAVVPYVLKMTGMGGRLIEEGFIVAISSNQGKTWSFVSGNPARMRELFPDLVPAGLRLPEVRPPKFERSSTGFDFSVPAKN
jgi:RNA polymerase sigma factor (sigma-70 family)